MLHYSDDCNTFTETERARVVNGIEATISSELIWSVHEWMMIFASRLEHRKSFVLSWMVSNTFDRATLARASSWSSCIAVCVCVCGVWSFVYSLSVLFCVCIFRCPVEYIVNGDILLTAEASISWLKCGEGGVWGGAQSPPEVDHISCFSTPFSSNTLNH